MSQKPEPRYNVSVQNTMYINMYQVGVVLFNGIKVVINILSVNLCSSKRLDCQLEFDYGF